VLDAACGPLRVRASAGIRLKILFPEAFRLIERFEGGADKEDALDQLGKNDDSHSTKTLTAQVPSACAIHLERYAGPARFESPILAHNIGPQAAGRASASVWPLPSETGHPKPLVSISLKPIQNMTALSRQVSSAAAIMCTSKIKKQDFGRLLMVQGDH
jgi:hypothetical protein